MTKREVVRAVYEGRKPEYVPSFQTIPVLDSRTHSTCRRVK